MSLSILMYNNNLRPQYGRFRTGLLRGMLILCIMVATPAWAEDNDADPDAPAEPTALPLDEALVRQAFALAENWVARGRVPDRTLPIHTRDLGAVHVTLRLDGLTLGQSTATVPEPQQRSASIDLMQYTQRAVTGALSQCVDNVKKLNAQMPRRQLPAELPDLAPLLQLDLQCARPPVVLRFESPMELPSRFRVDEHGLMLRHDQRSAWLFPGNAVASNLNLQAQIDRLLGRLELPASEMQRIGQEEGPALHRFQTIHLVRVRANEEPVALTRGQILLSSAPLNTQQTHAFTARWAQHLIERQQPSGWFAGTYLPSSNSHEPALSDPASCGLACFALARYANSLKHEAPQRQAAQTAAMKGVTALTAGLLGQTGLSAAERPIRLHLAECSTALIALLETPGTAKLKSQRDRLAGAIVAMQKPNGIFRNANASDARNATIPTASLAAYAMARMYEQVRQPQFHDAARRAIDVLLQETPATKMPSAYPWLAMAEFELARVGKPSTALITFREGALAILKKQVDSERISDTGIGNDAMGGFIQQAGLLGEPTWLSARPLTMIAAALRVESFVSEEERTLWLVDAGRGMRYLAQLTMDKPTCYYVRDPGRAIGGVRTAMWDNRQPLAATAMALLAGTELDLSLQAMKN